LLGTWEPVILRRRLVFLDDVPVEVADSYYPATIARGTALAETRKIKGGAVTLLANLGFRASVAHEQVTARQATAAERQLLEATDATWVLHLLRSVEDADGRPFEVSSMTMLASGRTLHYTVEIG
jgi:DNA-binding GntR family transcriptional regulator